MRGHALRLAARAVERALDADASDHVGPAIPCPCGSAARYAGRRPGTLTTALGELTLSRAYSVRGACGAGCCPRDRALGPGDGSLSPAVTRMVGHAAALTSFAEASDLPGHLAGVDVGPRTVERAAEALGREVAADERAVVEPGAPSAPTMYPGMDGTGVPMRPSEVAGRAGKGPDGKAHTWEARRRGFDRAARRVVIGDGATRIRNLTAELFPGAIEVVDLFHAKEHLSTVAKAVFGPTGELGRAWARERHAELDEGRIDDLLAALAADAGSSDEARRCVGYVTANRERMRYPEFRAQGLCVSSGVVEAGCRVVVGTRPKRSGMRWTLAGADAILALRACHLSGRFDRFWERRSRRPRARAA